jgi:hypothetical protein
VHASLAHYCRRVAAAESVQQSTASPPSKPRCLCKYQVDVGGGQGLAHQLAVLPGLNGRVGCLGSSRTRAEQTAQPFGGSGGPSFEIGGRRSGCTVLQRTLQSLMRFFPSISTERCANIWWGGQEAFCLLEPGHCWRCTRAAAAHTAPQRRFSRALPRSGQKRQRHSTQP